MNADEMNMVLKQGVAEAITGFIMQCRSNDLCADLWDPQLVAEVSNFLGVPTDVARQWVQNRLSLGWEKNQEHG